MIRRWRKKPPPLEHVEAMHAREHADRQLESAMAQQEGAKAQREDAKVQREAALSLAETLRQIRQRNHFGQSLENLNWSKQ